MVGTRKGLSSLSFLLLIVLGGSGVAASKASYPPSPVITELTWDSDVIKCGPDGSGDNWPITWVDDDVQITAFGDGDGFDGHNRDLSLGLARIFGDPPDFRGEDFASDADTAQGGGPRGIKASGLLMVDGILYMFVRNYKLSSSDDFTNSRLAWSRDRGVHWAWADWHFADTFGCPEFIQFGKNYQGARDNYVYIVSQANDSAYDYSPDIVLARVPKHQVPHRSQYEFFAGLDGHGNPTWSPHIESCKPIFTDGNGVQRIGMTYNAALQRYILTASHRPQGDKRTHTAALGVFDAPQPWGPWTTVYYSDHWSVKDGKDCRTYHHKFPTKWISGDGKTMWLLYSGLDGNLYAFCVKKATLEIARPVTKRKPGSPEHKGLASKYVGDKGIENDPDVIFAENFEDASLDAVKARWENVQSAEIMSLSPDVPSASAGRHSPMSAST